MIHGRLRMGSIGLPLLGRVGFKMKGPFTSITADIRQVMRQLVIPLLILLAACSRSGEPVLVTFDDLASHPEKFSDKEVIVDGVLAMGFEAGSFQHPTDPNQDSDIWWDYGTFPIEEEKARGFDKLRDAFARAPNKGEWAIERIVRVRIEGSFSHTNEPGRGFGHLSGSSSRIVINRVFEAEPWMNPESN